MIRNTNNLPQYPVSPNNGGGFAFPNQNMVINMAKCIANSQGQQQTVPVAGVFATLDGRTPNTNDIGTRIVYQHDPLQQVHIITGVQPINPQVGSVPTPWVTTTNPCGGGNTTPRTIIAVQCPLGPGLPFPYNFLARINGQSPNQSHIGQTISDGGNTEYKVTAVTNLAPPPGAPVYQFNTTNTPCDNQQVWGCTDPNATNYNPQATMDDGSCNYNLIVYGCTDPQAINYNPQATNDDGSCQYAPPPPPPPPQPTTARYISVKECPILPNAPIVMGYGVIDNQTPNQSHIGQTIVSYVGGTARLFKVMGLPVMPPNPQAPGLPIAYATSGSPCPIQVVTSPTIVGCTDPQALNFDPQANAQCNGCCQYAPRPNPTNPQQPMAMMQDSDTSEPIRDIRKGRGLSDERMNRYKRFRG